MLSSRVVRLTIVTLALGGMASTLLMGIDSHVEITSLQLLVLVVLPLAFVVAGLEAGRRQPENPLGGLVAATGLALFAWYLVLSNQRWVNVVGHIVQLLWFALFVHVIAAYPTGRLNLKTAKAAVAGAYFAALVLQPVNVLLDEALAGSCADCPPNPLAITQNPEAVEAITRVQLLIGVAVLVLLVVAYVARWRRSSSIQRKALLPIVVAGASVVLVLIGYAILRRVFGDQLAEGVADWLFLLAALAIPVALLVSVLRTDMSRARVSDLAVRLRTKSLDPGELERSLATALGDPSLAIAYWAPQKGAYVGSDGEAKDLSIHRSRSVRVIEQEGRRVAALLYDPALDDRPGLIDAVAATAGLALENEQLRAELRAQLADLRASRGRLVSAQDRERRRLERNLHDGAQQRLVGLGLALQLARSRVGDGADDAVEILDEAEDELRFALQELRELAQGLHPAILTENGLGPAIIALADRSPLQVTFDEPIDAELPNSVEVAAYFVVSEALTNAAKHSGASEATISVTRREDLLVVTVSDKGVGGADAGSGTGLTGLSDRVGAIGGRLVVVSPAGQGTTVTAELPCG